MEYLTAAQRAADEFTEKRSRFIGAVAPVGSEAEALGFINEIRAANMQARHNVYAYILRENNTVRYSDAGEPSGTGGQPILGVLQREGLTDVCVVVTRYFGGILLGAGGLTRAYAKAAKLAVDAGGICVMRRCLVYGVRCPYGIYDRLRAALERMGCALIEPEFGQEVLFRLCAPENEMPALVAAVREISSGTAACEAEDEKFVKFPK